MVVDAPRRSLEQRLDALQTANLVRSYRAGVKIAVKNREQDARALLLDPPELLWTMKVTDLLLAIPKMGAVKRDKLLRKCGVSPSKTIGGLSVRQRTELAALLR